jgi:hypothetical protein
MVRAVAVSTLFAVFFWQNNARAGNPAAPRIRPAALLYKLSYVRTQARLPEGEARRLLEQEGHHAMLAIDGSDVAMWERPKGSALFTRVANHPQGAMYVRETTKPTRILGFTHDSLPLHARIETSDPPVLFLRPTNPMVAKYAIPDLYRPAGVLSKDEARSLQFVDSDVHPGTPGVITMLAELSLAIDIPGQRLFLGDDFIVNASVHEGTFP